MASDHPVRSFRTLCLKCFAADRVEEASTDDKTIRVCRECGNVAVTRSGELVAEAAL